MSEPKEKSRRSHGDDDDRPDEERKRDKKREYPTDEESSQDDRRKRRKKERKRRRKERRKRREDDASSSSSEDDTHAKRKKSKDDAASSSASSYDASESDSSRQKKRKKKRKKEKKHKKKHRKEDRRKEDNNNSNSPPSFGKYGILKATDMKRMQRAFEVWMAQVKGIASFNGPKWELQNYFEEYREDFNTATLPHIKYYDYDKWELEEYQKQKAQQQEQPTGSVLADEALHRQEVQLRAQVEERKALNLIKSTMSREKVQDMKRQADLRAEMQIAFKTGDKKKYQRLKERLAADEK
jgi:hypothetical protein